MNPGIRPPQSADNALATQRVYSIDAFRGITILVMIFVNELAGIDGMPSWTTHAGADDDAMTYVDIVFPAFLFIVGMSLPIALQNRITKGESMPAIAGHIALRTTGLLVLGLFMVNSDGGYNEEAMKISLPLWSVLFFVFALLTWNSYNRLPKQLILLLRAVGIVGLIILMFLYKSGDGTSGMTPQWWGILGLIGWAYLFSCIIYLVSKNSLARLAIFTTLGFVFYIIAKEYADTGNLLLQFMNSARGHTIHTSITLSGTITFFLVFGNAPREKPFIQKLLYLALFTTVCLIAAVVLRPRYEVSKIYATPSWALFSIATCVIVYTLLYWLIDIRKQDRWVKWIQPAAANPLLAYLIPFVVYALMRLTDIYQPDIFTYGIPGVIWAAAYAFAVLGVVTILNKLKIKLQL